MGLFSISKKKEVHDLNQTSQIKNSSPLPPLNQTVPSQNNNLQENNFNQMPTPSINNQDTFVNPFRHEEQNNMNNSNTLNNSNNSNNFNQTISNQNNLSPTLENNNFNQMPTSSINNQMSESRMSPQINTLEVKTQLDEDKIQELIDETVEKLLEEKWNKIEEDINKVLKWKEKQDQQIDLIKSDILDMKQNVTRIEEAVINKIDNYNKDILDVNSEIRALEKVFQKITPTLINNVNELALIAKDLRGIKREEK